MRINKAKCKVLHLGQGNSQYQYRLGNEGIESSPAEKNLRVLVDEKLDVSLTKYACSSESQPYAGLHQKKCGGQQVEGGFSPSAQLWQTPAGVLHPALEPSIQ